MKSIYVYLIGLSDPPFCFDTFEKQIAEYRRQGIFLELSPTLKSEMTPEEKADDFNRAVRSRRYEWIVDVSGGDLANLVLPYLDYAAYAQSETVYCGFSDITCILNALSTLSLRPGLLFGMGWQSVISRVVSVLKNRQISTPIEGLHGEHWPRHARMFGGNIRCFLKLAGTPAMPDLSGSYLLIEGMSTGRYQAQSMIAHLVQTNALNDVRGIVFGRFNRLEKAFSSKDEMYQWLEEQFKAEGLGQCSFYKAERIGHIENSDALWISAGRRPVKNRKNRMDAVIEEQKAEINETNLFL